MNTYDNQFKAMYLQFFKPLTVFSYKFLRNLELAEDIVQNVFVSLYDNQNHLRIHTSLKSYLYRAVYNQTINALKMESKKYFIMEENPQEFEPFRDIMEETEFEHKIHLALDALPDGCKNVFMMSRNEGLSNKEIASKLNISIRTVETQISKALKILRERLYILYTLIFLMLESYC
jgi:RNA polymerase sigma-70 factor (ECF subfamily)